MKKEKLRRMDTIDLSQILNVFESQPAKYIEVLSFTIIFSSSKSQFFSADFRNGDSSSNLKGRL